MEKTLKQFSKHIDIPVSYPLTPLPGENKEDTLCFTRHNTPPKAFKREIERLIETEDFKTLLAVLKKEFKTLYVDKDGEEVTVFVQLKNKEENYDKL